MEKKLSHSHPATKQTYPPHSCGAVMVREVHVFHRGESVAKVNRELLKNLPQYKTINYIYVVDSRGALRGVVSIKNFFLITTPRSAIGKFASDKVVSVRPFSDRERAATLAVANNIKQVPVVDEVSHFLGVVPSDAVLQILHEEAVEDFLKMGGFTNLREPLKALTASSLQMVRFRLPWLMIGLTGGILVARFLGVFRQVLQREIILAFFMPTVVYVANATASQSQMLLIRSLALDGKISTVKYLFRELKTSLVIGLISGVVVTAAAWAWRGDLLVGFSIGLAMLLSTAIATLVAMLTTGALRRFGADPAIGSGPFATIIQDTLSLLIYFSVASLLLTGQ